MRAVASRWLLVIALLFGASARAVASPMVLASVSPVSGGLFQYDLTVDNTGGTEPLLGLIVVNANSVFGLTGSSTIGAPQDLDGNPDADWFAIPPNPPVIDLLEFFSLDPAGDIPIGGVLSGFFFRSMTAPGQLRPGDFAVEGVGSFSFAEIPLGDATIVPEPSVVLLVSSGLAGCFARRRYRRNPSARL